MKPPSGATWTADGAWLTSTDVPPLHPGDPGEGGGDDHDPVLDEHGPEGEPDDEDLGFRPPLPPEDRVWRHPSEVGLARAEVARRSRARRAAGVLVVSGGVAVALGAVTLLGGDDPRTSEREVAGRPAAAVDLGGEGAERAARSVAGLTATRDGVEVRGSAVVWDDDHLVTDAEVVRGADRIDVSLHDGATVTAELVGLDDRTGLAVVRVDADGLRPASLGSTGSLEVGAPALLVAAGAGGEPITATGSVTATGRRIEGHDGAARYGMIEIGARVAPSAAGGAVVDRTGALLGIASSAPASGGAAHGVASPVELVRHVAEQLVAHGRVRHVWLGLHGRDQDLGAGVDDVVPGGPAARAGVQPGDVVVAVDGEPTPSMASLIAALRLHLPGDIVTLTLHRDGARHDVRVGLAARDR